MGLMGFLNSSSIRMSTNSPVVHVADLEVDVIRKDIKNLHLGVYPPFGRVRVAAPASFDDEAVRLAVVSRLGWIRKKSKQIQDQARQSRREMIDGEAHYVWGRKYRLRIVEDGARGRVELKGEWLHLYVPMGAERQARERRLTEWYREQLKTEISPVVERWAPVLGIPEPAWAVRRMKTKWGTCKPDQAKIWINLELAKKPHPCLEYIVVHEMIHLLERNHTDRFYVLQDRFLPSWKTLREVLNGEPLADENWDPAGDASYERRRDAARAPTLPHSVT
jgi:predicted metal-dependent hydrolase